MKRKELIFNKKSINGVMPDKSVEVIHKAKMRKNRTEIDMSFEIGIISEQPIKIVDAKILLLGKYFGRLCTVSN